MMVLVTGGASCGKSAFAERLCTTIGGNLVYLAAMRPFGEEGRQRVLKHRAQRDGKGFATVECYEGLENVLENKAVAGSTALLECLGNVVANELFSDGSSGDGSSGDGDSDVGGSDDVGSGDGGSDRDPDRTPDHGTRTRERIARQLVAQIDALAGQAAHVVIVGNDVGCDGVAYPDETRMYQKVLGEVTNALATRCELVVECVAGVPSVLKWTHCADVDSYVGEVLGLHE